MSRFVDRTEKVLFKIERLEQNWRYPLSDSESKLHSFGRVKEDGKTVAFWSIPRSTGEFLEFLVQLTNAKKILELGCSAGYSTIFLARGARKTKGKVITTEILPVKAALARKHFKEAGLEKRISLLKEDISLVLERLPSNQFDFVFLDADKEKYAFYFKKLLRLLKKNGVIVVDNAGKVRMPDGKLFPAPHMPAFIRLVKKTKQVASVFLDFDNGLLLVLKR